MYYKFALKILRQHHYTITNGYFDIRSEARLAPDSKKCVSCHTIDKDYVRTDNISQLSFREGAITQTTDVARSNLGGATHYNKAIFPMQLPVTGPSGGVGQL